jgi:hypothetical protein
MATKLNIKLDQGWDKLRKWSLALQGNLEKAIRVATKKSVLYVYAKIVENIQEGNFADNSPLTFLIKQKLGRNTTPLIGKNNSVIKSISTEVLSSFEGEVGILMGRKSSKGSDMANIGKLLHDGGTIQITDKMRLAFVKFLGGIGIEPDPSKGRKNIIRIPPRKFIEDVFDDPLVQERIRRFYKEEISKYTGI